MTHVYTLIIFDNTARIALGSYTGGHIDSSSTSMGSVSTLPLPQASLACHVRQMRSVARHCDAMWLQHESVKTELTVSSGPPAEAVLPAMGRPAYIDPFDNIGGRWKGRLRKGRGMRRSWSPK